MNTFIEKKCSMAFICMVALRVLSRVYRLREKSRVAAEIGTEEVKKSGKFVLPGLCMIKTRTKAAVKGGGTRMMFGKEVKIRPQPAKTVVKAFAVSQLKSQI